MGRRHGTVDPRVLVSVSESMATLRRIQGTLNGFWQTSELAYGYLLSDAEKLCCDPEHPTASILGHIESNVWFPNNQGRIKRTDTISRTMKQVRENTTHVYRATLLSFFSAFEAYLKAQVAHLKPDGLSWGEYVRSLAHTNFRDTICPLPLQVILCADICREIRNDMTHENFSVPDSLSSAKVLEWKNRLSRRACAAEWPQRDVSVAINYAFHQVIGQAINHVNEAKEKGKELPIELFYMLFTFTNLDSLAFAIEEALLDSEAKPTGRITRKKTAVNRHDLIIGSVNGTY